MSPPWKRRQQPIHWDNHRSSFNFTLIFALVVAVLGVMGNWPLLFIGVGVAAYSWLTTPRQYLIYRDTLVIRYGTPRVKPIPFATISHLETLALPMGERLRVRMVDGKRTFLTAKDPDTFRQHLEQALGRYHDDQSGSEWVETEGRLVEDQPLNTAGTVFETDEPPRMAPPDEPPDTATPDEPTIAEVEPSPQTQPDAQSADDVRGPVTPIGDTTTTTEEERRTPY